jgi:small subunit ribosomal protein S1
VVRGSIASVERFGLFIELLEGIEGLLHISELSRASCADDLYRSYACGDEVAVRILDITPEDHRIALAPAGTEEAYVTA